MPRLRRRYPASDPSPGHDHGVRREALHPAFQDLIPPDECSAMRSKELTDLRREPALQLVFAVDPELLNARLCDGTRLPFILDRFVTAGVDVVTGEECHHFGQHV